MQLFKGKEYYTVRTLRTTFPAFHAGKQILIKILKPRFLKSRLINLNKKKLAATYFPAWAVSSALESLTSVFGMGTGISSPLWPPAFYTFSRQKILLQNLPASLHQWTFNSGLKRYKVLYSIWKKHSRYPSNFFTDGNDNMVKPHDLLVMLGSMHRCTYTCILSTR